MPKDQKTFYEIPEEMVENLQEKIGWINSTIKCWHYDKIWPMNLINEICDNIYYELEFDRLKDFKCVSLSHIIDK